MSVLAALVWGLTPLRFCVDASTSGRLAAVSAALWTADSSPACLVETATRKIWFLPNSWKFLLSKLRSAMQQTHVLGSSSRLIWINLCRAKVWQQEQGWRPSQWRISLGSGNRHLANTMRSSFRYKYKIHIHHVSDFYFAQLSALWLCVSPLQLISAFLPLKKCFTAVKTSYFVSFF